jgi:serine protease
LFFMRRAMLVLAALSLAVLSASPALAVTNPPNDPLWPDQWGPRQVHAPEAWSRSTGAGAIVAVVDSGVDLTHPDLAGQLVAGATFFGCADNGPCGNGDWTSGGGVDEPHGTHVAGIVAAATDNGIGVAGVAPDAKVMPVKVIDAEGGSFEEIAAGIRYAADHGADVINMSLGAIPGVQVLEFTGVIADVKDAIAYANDKGVAVIVASGNDSFPLCGSPSFNDGAMCVTATDSNEAHSWYSNGALKPDLLAVAAPGGQGALFCEEDVVSTVPAGSESTCGSNGYDYYAGTSMAAPHVSGVAALLAAQGATNTQLYDTLTSTARKPGTDVRGVYDPVYGYGIVDAVAATATLPPATTTTTTTTTGSGKGHKKTR